MSYVFDNGPLSMLFRNFFPTVFETLWTNFDALVTAGDIISVREVAREVEDSSIERLVNWAAANPDVFALPTPAETAFITDIYGVRNFQHNIEQQKLLRGGRVADPFVIAKAHLTGGTVVTTEHLRPNGAKVPNICQHFGVQCLHLQEFMEAEGWRF